MGTVIATVVFRVLVIMLIILFVVLVLAKWGMPIFGAKLHHTLEGTISLSIAILAALLSLTHCLIKDSHKP